MGTACVPHPKTTICHKTANSCSAHNYWFSRSEKDETVTMTEKQDYFITTNIEIYACIVSLTIVFFFSFLWPSSSNPTAFSWIEANVLVSFIRQIWSFIGWDCEEEDRRTKSEALADLQTSTVCLFAPIRTCKMWLLADLAERFAIFHATAKTLISTYKGKYRLYHKYQRCHVISKPRTLAVSFERKLGMERVKKILRFCAILKR